MMLSVRINVVFRYDCHSVNNIKMNSQDLSPEQRLNQIELLLATAAKNINRTTELSNRNAETIERNSKAIERNTESIERLSEDSLDLRLSIERLSQMFTESVGIMRKQQINIEKMQSEIRGLQVENQRILHRVFGENNFDQS
jgi:aspartate oxidase